MRIILGIILFIVVMLQAGHVNAGGLHQAAPVADSCPLD